MTNIGLLHTGIRGDEKLLIQAAKDRNVNLELIDVRKQVLDPHDKSWSRNEVYLERCISTTKGFHAVQYLTTIGVPVLNSLELAVICDSKFDTSNRLINAGVPTVDAYLAFTEEQSKEAVEKLGGYPVVVKSDSGSWGRLMSKVNDSDTLETVIDHKHTLGGPVHSAIYLQQYIDKPGRDIRAFVFGGELKAAIYRSTEHWITNTARGAKASNCELNNDLNNVCTQVAKALATKATPDGGLLAIDVFEDEENGYVINEVNHTMEFKNSEEPTGVSISGETIEYCVDYVS